MFCWLLQFKGKKKKTYHAHKIIGEPLVKKHIKKIFTFRYIFIIWNWSIIKLFTWYNSNTLIIRLIRALHIHPWLYAKA